MDKVIFPGINKRLSSLQLITLLWRAVPNARKKQLVILQLVCLLAALGEVVNLGALLPILRLIANPLKTSELIVSFIPFLHGVQPNYVVAGAGILLLVTISLTTLLRTHSIRLQLTLSALITSDLGDRVFYSVLSKPYYWHTKTNASVVLSHLFHDVDSVFAAIQALLLLAMNSTIVILLVVTLLALSPSLMVSACLFLGLFYTLVYQHSRKSLRNNGKLEALYYQKSLQVVQESLGGIRDVILDRSQSYFLESFQHLNKQRRLSGAAINIKAQVPRYLVEGFTVILVVGLAISLSLMGNSLEESIPLLGTFSLGLYRLLQPLQQCFGSLSTIHANYHALLKLEPFLADTTASQPFPIPGSSQLIYSVDPNTPLISLDNVSFQYSEREFAIKNISLNIFKGERIAFVGRTGSGKSTVSDIILGLIQPSSGTVSLNVYDIRDSSQNLNGWQSLVAHVPQQIYLSDASFASNIAFAVPENLIDMRRVHKAARQACIADLIKSTDNGYDTIVGERGVRLSGGQRQRIGIARALYKKARLLVFDEATSALDVRTESEVMDAIIDIDRSVTVIMIAHRLSTIRHCDRIVFVDSGSIKAVGTYDELKQGNARFREFISKSGYTLNNSSS